MPQYLSRDPNAGQSMSSSGGSGRQYLSTDPNAGGAAGGSRRRGWGDYAGLALRGLAGVFGAPGGVIGSLASGAAELPAQFFERTFGSRESYEPLQVATQAGLGAIPFGKVLGAAKGAKALLAAGGKGATLGAGGAASTELTRQLGANEDIDLGSIGRAATTGGVIGAGGGALGAGLAGKFLNRGRGAAASAEEMATKRAAYRQSRGFDPTPAPVAAAPPDPLAMARGQQKLLPFDLPEEDIERTARETILRGQTQQAATSKTVADMNRRMDVLLGRVRRAEEGVSGAAPSLSAASQRPLDFMTAAPRAATRAAEAAEDPLTRALREIESGTGDDVARAGRQSVELIDPEAAIRNNASGESMASLEAISRNQSMRAKGEQFVAYTRTGEKKILTGADAVDYPVSGMREGEVFGVEGPGGFRVLENRGGRVPPHATAPAAAAPQTAAEIARAKGKTFIPAELVALRSRLAPQWAETEATTGVRAGEDLLPFARRILGEPNERALMGGERAAMRNIRAAGKPVLPGTAEGLPAPAGRPQALESMQTLRVRRPGQYGGEEGDEIAAGSSFRKSYERRKAEGRLTVKEQAREAARARGEAARAARTTQTGDEGGGVALGAGPGDDSGQISTEALMRLGLGATGALTGAAMDDENPLRGALGYGTLGALSPSLFMKGGGGTASKLGEKLGQLRYFSMLGKTSAQAKNIIGNAGTVTIRAGEELMQGNTDKAKSILSNVFTPETANKVVAAFKKAGREPDTRWGSTAGPLGIPSRVMHAVDEGITDSLKKAGIDPTEAKDILFTGMPKSKTGRWIASRPQAMSALMPFVRTAVNLGERGLEHTPGIGMLPAVRAMRNPNTGQLVARQAMGALAAAAGATVGSNNPYVGAALGPLALPYEAGGAARRALEKKGKGDPLSKIAREEAKLLMSALPLPNEAFDYDPGRFLASFVPGILGDASLVAPNEFDTSGSIFDPSIAKIPVLNEAVLPRKVRR
jgi:hypothetical protein